MALVIFGQSAMTLLCAVATALGRVDLNLWVYVTESLVEAASWLLRLTDDYRHSVVVLREVKSVRFGNLMQPGKALEVTAELVSRDGEAASFKTTL